VRGGGDSRLMVSNLSAHVTTHADCARTSGETIVAVLSVPRQINESLGLRVVFFSAENLGRK
jgi:hypothetical protein